jgi:hypothetical protein
LSFKKKYKNGRAGAWLARESKIQASNKIGKCPNPVFLYFGKSEPESRQTAAGSLAPGSALAEHHTHNMAH